MTLTEKEEKDLKKFKKGLEKRSIRDLGEYLATAQMCMGGTHYMKQCVRLAFIEFHIRDIPRQIKKKKREIKELETSLKTCLKEAKDET